MSCGRRGKNQEGREGIFLAITSDKTGRDVYMTVRASSNTLLERSRLPSLPQRMHTLFTTSREDRSCLAHVRSPQRSQTDVSHCVRNEGRNARASEPLASEVLRAPNGWSRSCRSRVRAWILGDRTLMDRSGLRS